MSKFTKEEIAFLEKNVKLSVNSDGEIGIRKVLCDIGDVFGNVDYVGDNVGLVYGNVGVVVGVVGGDAVKVCGKILNQE
tara:strand:- start:223 stop:459 length:237 start_codon:yes stop_codon:yes gene_type:complete